jgi:hypothetical protein
VVIKMAFGEEFLKHALEMPKENTEAAVGDAIWVYLSAKAGMDAYQEVANAAKG